MFDRRPVPGWNVYLPTKFAPSENDVAAALNRAAFRPLTVHDDAGWLRDLVSRLTDHREAARDEPWRVTDAPETFIAGQLKAIVGVEIVIERVEAKAKMSQNQPARNRADVVAGLSAGSPMDQAVAQRVSELDPDGSTNA
jgi:transcriptional regulator